jgi:GYF domain 2
LKKENAMSNDQFSVDKMLELGFGLAVAQQIANTTAVMLKNTAPVVSAPTGTTRIEGQRYLLTNLYIAFEGAPAGPFDEDKALQLCREGRLVATTLVWVPGQAGWMAASSVPEVHRLFALTPPPLPGA